MIGKLLKINIILFFLWLLPTGNALGLDSGSVVVLLSDTMEIYQKPVASFCADVGLPVKRYNLHGDPKQAPALKKKIFREKPALILAVGAKAAYIAKIWTRRQQDIPVIFIMVLDWQRYSLTEGQDNITGISMEISPGTQFANMLLFSPRVKRLGIICSTKFAAGTQLRQIRQTAALLGLELVVNSIGHPREFKRAFKEVSPRVDAFLMLNDPLVLSLDNADWIEQRCVKDRLVCIGQAEELTQFGMLLSTNPDIPYMGSQAASMARNIIIRRQKPKEIGVMAPLGTQISVNLETAAKINLAVENFPLHMATKIFSH